MALIRVRNVAKYFSADPVLADVSFDVQRGEKVGLVGPNGCGKTTLLNLMAGKLDADRGEISSQRAIRIGYLEQTFSGDRSQTMWSYIRTAMSEQIELMAQAERLAEQIATATHDDARQQLAQQFDAVQERLHQSGGFHFDHEIKRVLHGLGFTDDQLQQPIQSLSGGQVNRLMLAHLLLSEPDLMLLDEPSNHLDLPATEWLEQFLRASPLAYIVVSHDRYLLDRVTDRTLELIDGSVDSYPASYSHYVTLRHQRLEVQRRTYEKQQEEIQKLEEFIRRNHYGQKAAQAEDRRKKLAQIERVPRPREIESPPMRFVAADRAGDIILRAEKLSKAFERPLFRDLSFQVQRGERWGILGANGTGKTTLLRCLLGIDRDHDGEVSWGTGVRHGYFDQRLDCISDDEMALDSIRPNHAEMFDQQRRDMLARFGIVGDTALQTVKSLSGGQRNRVALARLAALEANMLIMDEPTNHLDLWSRESLAEAIRDYGGTVLLVSHDRYFVNQVCDHLIVMQPDSVRIIHGNYDTWRLLEARESDPARDNQRPRDDAEAPTPTRRKRKFPYRKTADIEAEIEEVEWSIEKWHLQLSEPDVVRDRDRTLEIRQQLENSQERLQQLYEHWNEACELNG